MIDIDLNELHQVQFNILKEFDRVCKKHGLTYFLGYGTLLGAIRHKGFIPWDDDIDVVMLSDQYEKLMQIPQSEWNPRYFMQNSETDPNFTVCFTKIRDSETTLINKIQQHLDINHGVDIDVYPLCKLSDNPNQRKRQYLRTMLYMLLVVNEPPDNHGKIYYYGGKIILTLLPDGLRRRMIKRLKKQITKWQNQDVKEAYLVNGNIEVMRETVQCEWFKSTREQEFEGQMFPVPIGAEKWLATRYGKDFMELPPPEMRGVKLDVFAKIDLHSSYKKYRGIDYAQPGPRKQHVRNKRIGKYS
ncbi:MAG: LicD family protein [Clostridia bacterium]|nr:LicD family protein [Clostridia bacterium]